jgi:hypothetical protein
VPAVWRPEAARAGSHRDQRIEERAGLLDLLGEALRMRGGEVPLEGGRVHGFDRERRDEQGAPREGVPVRPDRGAAGLGHRGHERRERGVVEPELDLAAREPAPLLGRREPLARRPGLARPGRLLLARTLAGGHSYSFKQTDFVSV